MAEILGQRPICLTFSPLLLISDILLSIRRHKSTFRFWLYLAVEFCMHPRSLLLLSNFYHASSANTGSHVHRALQLALDSSVRGGWKADEKQEKVHKKALG